MCLAVPGIIIEIDEDAPLRSGRVSFAGVLRDVCLAYTPEARVGDFVMVHVGFALSVVDEAEAAKTLGYLQEIGELE